MNNELKEYIENNILPQYKDYDKAHRTDHILTVIEESLNLATRFEAEIDMVYTIAAYHDLGLPEGRATHHLTSAKRLLGDNNLKKWFTNEQLATMAQAIEDHRASSDHEPRSIYGRIVAEADRIIDPETVICRTVQYGLSHYPELNKEEQYKRMLAHMHEKYAEGGYLKLWIPESSNAKRLVVLRDIIKDEKRLREIFDAIYIKALDK